MQEMATREPFSMKNEENNQTTSSQHSPWHSPVPYLFGGLAAMLGFIALALLILVCSYCKLSGYGDRDLEAGHDDKAEEEPKKPNPYISQDKFLVITAGGATPTYLATPVCRSASTSRSSSFGESIKSCTCSEENETNLKVKMEKMEEGSDSVQASSMGSHDGPSD